MLKWQERHLEIIGGVGNPYSIPKGGFVGEKKCRMMDLAKLQIVQGPKLPKTTCNESHRHLEVHECRLFNNKETLR